MKLDLRAARPRLLVRHLDAETVPWRSEPIDTVFTLVSAADSCLLFDGISYRFDADGSLTVIALIGGEGETPSTATLEFERFKQ